MSETTTFVIFGASGDLTRRKLVPALFDLHQKNRIWANWRIVGVSRTEFSNEEFHARMRGGVSEFGRMMCTDEEWYEFSARISYFPGSLSDLDTMHELDAYLKKMEGDETSNRVYYLSIAPDLYIPAVQNLGAAEMAVESNGWRRLVIEKPFGHDLASAQELNSALHEVFDESQVYRIDHYLGKETVQNIMVFRFANSLFEPVWNRNYIDHVQITAAETVDVGHRAHFYDGVGIMRDMMQNHMMQLLALVAVEPPASYEADSLRNEKVKILKAVRPIKPEQTAEHTVRGQYRSYRDAEGVAEKSQTATFAAIKLYIDNWRWQGVPFYLRSGKALAGKTTNITIFFKQPPHLMFNLPPETRIDNN